MYKQFVVDVEINLEKLISSSVHNTGYLEQNQQPKHTTTHTNNRCQVSVS